MNSQTTVSTRQDTPKGRTITLAGRLDNRGAGVVWQQAEELVASCRAQSLVLDLDKVDYLDSAGAALVATLETRWKEKNRGAIRIQGLPPESEPLVDLARRMTGAGPGSKRSAPSRSFVENRGRALSIQLERKTEFISHVGEIFWALAHALFHPSTIRWKDALLAAERAGVNALPIVALISFIVGLVMAFQSAMPMKMFGAEIYVANLIGIAMVRELSPLMTAIILAGRSGAAFAAEIGTMKINEEIDALTTMGLDPVRFLMVPRILAAVFITPLLTIFANFVGIMGGSVVLISMGYPAVTYYNQVISFVTWIDFTGGLVKCFVFGMLIACAGCIRGIQATSGPSAVGIATTRAVVTGIILIAVFDGIFSVLYYCLGI
ncbi:MAG: MlaE family lipid ABC transporter permease subunit [Desulfobacteraceae bacterium]|nr:MlaE family lipid ABC transporter permease subunit [Desulfobacteraceae bacterium]